MIGEVTAAEHSRWVPAWKSTAGVVESRAVPSLFVPGRLCLLGGMDEATFQLVRTLSFLAAAAVALGLERASPHARFRGSWRVNLGLWVLDLAVERGVRGVRVRSRAGGGQSGLNVAAAPAWVAVPVTVVALDLVSYGWHRANHTLALLWRFHRVHHSDTTFTVSTALRFHPGELLLSLPLRLGAVAALGAPAAAVVAFEAIFTLANLVEHGDIDLPARLERGLARVVVTPALHRRHHGIEPAQLGSNFGTVFTWWDKLLGTYGASGSSVRVTIGLAATPRVGTVLGALALPLAPRAGGRPA
jgi:sterol desaturase/sphingolipid hydroxylase (fatty acid hydroxylase superfamily)